MCYVNISLPKFRYQMKLLVYHVNPQCSDTQESNDVDHRRQMSWKAKAISSTEKFRHQAWRNRLESMQKCPTFLMHSPDLLNNVEDVSCHWSWLKTLRYFKAWGCWGSEFQRVSIGLIHFSRHVAAMWTSMTSTGWWWMGTATGSLCEANKIR